MVVFPVPFIPRKSILNGSPFACFASMSLQDVDVPALVKIDSIAPRSFSFTNPVVLGALHADIPGICFFRSPVTLSTTFWATSLSIRASWKLKSASSRSFSESFFSETDLASEEKASLSFSNILLALLKLSASMKPGGPSGQPPASAQSGSSARASPMMFSSSSFALASRIFSASSLVFSTTTLAPMPSRTLSAFGGDAREQYPAPTGTRTSSVIER